ncbi:hypothetical protein [Poriferisphaera corsica]|nr:hypothetical protein [Poriferisphaera corsica]
MELTTDAAANGKKQNIQGEGVAGKIESQAYSRISRKTDRG